MKKFLTLVKNLMEKVFDLRIYRGKHLPIGLDFFKSMHNDFPHSKFFSIFDVGANVGQSAIYYAKQFPEATIYSFEPVPSTFQQLRIKTINYPQIKIYQVALGSLRKKLPMMTQSESCLSSFVSAELMDGSFTQEMVDVVTLDEFIAENQIQRIDFLKIDVEGFELEVLHGARQALENGKINFIQIEFGFGVTKVHNTLDKFLNFLNPKGYALYGIYEQSLDWKAGAPWLMFANAVFIRRALKI